jgi:hypothetical protein
MGNEGVIARGLLAFRTESDTPELACTPALMDELMVIEGQGIGRVTGVFDSLPDGGVRLVSDGNDLTRVNIPERASALSFLAALARRRRNSRPIRLAAN